MSRCAKIILASVVLALATPVAVGYIHYPPMTLQKLCKISTHIRVLSGKEYDQEKRVVSFEHVRNLKGEDAPVLKSETGPVTAFRHVIRADADGLKPILGWVGDNKRAVMFTIEGGTIACGYVFLDKYCYSVDYNRGGRYWLVIQAEPVMSACYHGSARQLESLTKDVLAGKEVKVPVKEPVSPQTKEERQRRSREVNDILVKNRKKRQ
jgi:hypothetical protein